MKTCKIIARTVLIATCFITPFITPFISGGHTQEPTELDISFLQDIQQQLTQISGQRGQQITFHITPDKKRIIDLTPTSVSLSYGFLKNMDDISQLIATMAHMTAHITANHIKAPLSDENTGYGFDQKTVETFIESNIRPTYPDRKSPPQATGSFHNDGPQTIERATYNNPDYTFAVNKADIKAAEQENTSDRLATRILKHAGFCPADYSRMMHFFYEHPQRLLGSIHFALDDDQWQRVDVLDGYNSPETKCTPDQQAKTSQYGQAFRQLQDKIRLELAKIN